MESRIPPEILTQIFSLACTDGTGVTYLSLRSLSRYTRNLVESCKYHSFTLDTPGKIRKAVDEMSKLPPWMRNVHTLSVSDSSTVSSASPVKQKYDLSKTEIMYLISLSAPTLETLSFDASSSPFSSTSLVAQLFATPFANLVDLTITGFYPYPHPTRTTIQTDDATSSLKITRSTLPMLQRLHLLGNRNPVGLLQAGNLDEACPALRELKISGLAQAVSFALEVDAAASCRALARSIAAGSGSSPMKVGGQQTRECPWPSRLPPQLERLVLSCAYLPEAHLRGTAGLKNAEMVRVFDGIEKKSKEEKMFGLRVRVVQESVEDRVVS